MRIGKYRIEFTSFKPLPWSRYDIYASRSTHGYNENGTGTVYHSSGWLFFIIRWEEKIWGVNEKNK